MIYVLNFNVVFSARGSSEQNNSWPGFWRNQYQRRTLLHAGWTQGLRRSGQRTAHRRQRLPAFQSNEIDYLSLFSLSNSVLQFIFISFKIAALQLVEQGKAHLDTPVYDLLPELASPVVLDGSSGENVPGFKPAEREITLRQLLNHTSGLFYLSAVEGDPPDGASIPLVARYDKDDPILQFSSLVKVGVD
jgi:hypothetical protein